ncbi:UDP-glucose 4-epimerase GalE [Enterobacter hormaechei]|uniref:UDP-glucose 4-epimerase n=1 Tax=Enterobacter cloacae TaxID=550 RepID=A0A6B9XYW2_ENTCL|nr:UDP-glucose 4-epimerase GalE [Enterobacter hormaechei]QHR93393.1 UDP-glucose 4-epimerase [Enterobacter cloacae]HBM2851617.1 UDP-glucose 4-epimerase GalE [Enterobacter hormaechei subsp. xiangfangensis]HED2222930.1 UDP-glucose 4-epimerase GalE [Enterobacter hormaechei subsp. steigerwaltii]AXO39857.1 UDP-glucose 4-epimerase GalE [Enterobacter hormaechei]EHN8909658.1 UDP-glucose 4-epimerase GalE [Enterobacter hormaechei]
MTVLVTGGLGYIGSHTVVELLNKNFNVVVLDNLSNSNLSVIKRINELCGESFCFYKGDILDSNVLNEIFRSHSIESVIHFAGLKSVSESISKPIKYYNDNISGTLNLLNVMNFFDVKKVIFSSSATVYGQPQKIPLTEQCPIGGTTNPYGTSKFMIEKILMDLSTSDAEWDITILRYFNPVGAHPSGLLGEEPKGTPNNLVPYLTKVAIGELESLSIYGNDYNTVDGTGVRDFIHVCDLATGHISALENMSGTKLKIYNLGTGVGTSVLNLIKTFENVNKVSVPYSITARRDGDIGECWADATLAMRELKWKAKYDLADMLRHAWNWQIKNPSRRK